MADLIEFPPAAPQPEFLVGPFEEYRVVVEGRMIPRLTGFTEGDLTYLIVDRRFSVGVPHEFARSVAWLLANALAVGAGYSHLGADSRDTMPFAPLATSIDPPEGSA